MKPCQHQPHSSHPMYGPSATHGHGHHHHGASVYPSPSSSAAVSAAHGAGPVATCCGHPSGYPGAHTLPTYSGQLDPATGQCYRSRTLSSMGPCAPPADQYGQWLSISPRAIGLFALSLVFILIWSTLISGVLINHSLKEHETALHTAELFEMHRDVGQLAYAVGKEMLFTLNTSMSSLDNQVEAAANVSAPLSTAPNTTTEAAAANTLPTIDLHSIRAKWNKTDQTLQQLSQSLATKGYVDFESDIQDQLEKLRSKCVHQVNNQWSSVLAANGSVTLFPLLADCVRTFEQSFETLDSILLKDTSWLGDRHSKLTMTDLLIRNMPYTLFVRGMVHRFTSLGLGLILVGSNFTQPVNMSEYFHYYFSSRQLIESSFVWNYRFLQKYLELDSTDYQADMLLQFFDSRRAQENDFYLKMSAIFSRMFSFETLTKIRSYIKKKNVESVERLLVNGSRTKFIADQDANLVSIQLNTDLIEMMGLENIEQVMYGHQQMLALPQATNLKHKYYRLLRNQIGFMSRVQDFLNISLSSHLTQSTLNEQHSLLYHTILSIILFFSVLFCLALFLCSYCCSRSPPCTYGATSKSTLGRRMWTRRRLWNISSPFSLFKLCFSSPFSSPTSPPRYPLLYKSSTHHTHYQPHSPNQMSHHQARCPTYCSSPSNQLVAAGRRGATACAGGGLIHRYPGPPAGLGQPSSSSSAPNAKLTYKYEKSRHTNGTAAKQTETTSLIDDHAAPRTQASTSEPSCMCCISCPADTTGCPVEPCVSVDRSNECAKCAATGKCSTCCPFNRDDDIQRDNTAYFGGAAEKAAYKTPLSKDSTKDSKQSLHSSTLSIRSDSKSSSKSTAKESAKLEFIDS